MMPPAPARRWSQRKGAVAQGHYEAGKRRPKFESKVRLPTGSVGQADDNQAPRTRRASSRNVTSTLPQFAASSRGESNKCEGEQNCSIDVTVDSGCPSFPVKLARSD